MMRNYGSNFCFPEGWKISKIKETFNIYPTASYSRTELTEDDLVKYIHYGDIHTKFDFHLDVNIHNLPRIPESRLKNFEILKDGDLVIADASEDYDGVGKAIEVINIGDNRVIAGLHTFHIRDKSNNFAPRFKGFVLLSSFVREQMYRLATGTKVYSISKETLKELKLPLPPLPEQNAIADCLTTWDDAIEKQTQLIKAKEERHKALMQQLLSGKKRLPSFTEEWKEYKYSELVKEVKRKEIWDDTKLYELISVKRRSGGVFHRDSLYGYQIEVKALVKIKENDFLISKMQIVHGASSIVNKEFENFYVSGSYIILNVKNEKVLNPKFINLFSKQKYFYYQTFVSSYGVHIEKMTFDFKTFLKTTAVIPSISEQNSIVEIIETSENELSLEKQKLNQLKEQKKALMQKLLIGKVRLPFAS